MLSDNLQKERRILRTKASYKLGRYGSENAVPDGTASMPTKYSYKDTLSLADKKMQNADKPQTTKRRAGC
jgi:hypothetical protein